RDPGLTRAPAPVTTIALIAPTRTRLQRWSSMGPATALFAISLAFATTAPKSDRTDSKLDRVIKPWLGTPWAYAGTEAQRGADCCGFTSEVAREGFTVELPHSRREQYRLGKVVKRAQLRPGDLVFFSWGGEGGVDHV